MAETVTKGPITDIFLSSHLNWPLIGIVIYVALAIFGIGGPLSGSKYIHRRPIFNEMWPVLSIG